MPDVIALFKHLVPMCQTLWHCSNTTWTQCARLYDTVQIHHGLNVPDFMTLFKNTSWPQCERLYVTIQTHGPNVPDITALFKYNNVPDFMTLFKHNMDPMYQTLWHYSNSSQELFTPEPCNHELDGFSITFWWK